MWWGIRQKLLKENSFLLANWVEFSSGKNEPASIFGCWWLLSNWLAHVFQFHSTQLFTCQIIFVFFAFSFQVSSWFKLVVTVIIIGDFYFALQGRSGLLPGASVLQAGHCRPCPLQDPSQRDQGLRRRLLPGLVLQAVSHVLQLDRESNFFFCCPNFLLHVMMTCPIIFFNRNYPIFWLTCPLKYSSEAHNIALISGNCVQ